MSVLSGLTHTISPLGRRVEFGSNFAANGADCAGFAGCAG
jgi:hypothetical protein